MEAAAVEGSAVLEHGVDGLQEFAHGGTNGLDLLEATGLDEVAESSLTLGSWREALSAGM